MSVNNRNLFEQYLHSTNQEGSGKARSYVRALDLLQEMLQASPEGFHDCQDFWNLESPQRLQELYSKVLLEQNKGKESNWAISSIPPSYLKNRYCSAALKQYKAFLFELEQEQLLLKFVEQFKGDESSLAEQMLSKLNSASLSGDLDADHGGKDVERRVKVRLGQNVFRKMILSHYNNRCCITGLSIPEVNRASHIVGWAEQEAFRLDPHNGLCLSATYDAAFDRKLFSLDDDYRIILSRELKEHYTDRVAREFFLSKEGQRIELPQRFLPAREHLDHHRRKGCF